MRLGGAAGAAGRAADGVPVPVRPGRRRQRRRLGDLDPHPTARRDRVGPPDRRAPLTPSATSASASSWPASAAPRPACRQGRRADHRPAAPHDRDPGPHQPVRAARPGAAGDRLRGRVSPLRARRPRPGRPVTSPRRLRRAPAAQKHRLPAPPGTDLIATSQRRLPRGESRRRSTLGQPYRSDVRCGLLAVSPGGTPVRSLRRRHGRHQGPRGSPDAWPQAEA